MGIEASKKPAKITTRMPDCVCTVPRGTMFSCCGMNVAFDRELVGPSMYFGIMGHGYPVRPRRPALAAPAAPSGSGSAPWHRRQQRPTATALAE